MSKSKVAQNMENIVDHPRLIRCEQHLGEESGVLIGVVGVGKGVGVGCRRPRNRIVTKTKVAKNR